MCLYLWGPPRVTKVFKNKIWFASLNMCYNVLIYFTVKKHGLFKLDIYVVAASNTSVEIIDLLDLQKIFIRRGRELIIPRALRGYFLAPNLVVGSYI